MHHQNHSRNEALCRQGHRVSFGELTYIKLRSTRWKQHRGMTVKLPTYLITELTHLET